MPPAPARPLTITSVLRGLDVPSWTPLGLSPLATLEQLGHAHDQQLRDRRIAGCACSGIHDNGSQRHAFDPDTHGHAGHPGGGACAPLVAAVAATDAVIDGHAWTNAFCAVRPPGHHATRGHETMGFCFFNNVCGGGAACAGRCAACQRVAVVDFDVHHGNGTEDILVDDDRVLMVGLLPASASIPGTGGVHPLGHQHDQRALACPTPMRRACARTGRPTEWIPRACMSSSREMIFISAGFDGHREDEMGGLNLVEADYAWITEPGAWGWPRRMRPKAASCPAWRAGMTLSSLARIGRSTPEGAERRSLSDNPLMVTFATSAASMAASSARAAHPLTPDEMIRLWHQLLQPEALVELVAFLGCLALAWLLVRLLRVASSRDPRSIWFGRSASSTGCCSRCWPWALAADRTPGDARSGCH